MALVSSETALAILLTVLAVLLGLLFKSPWTWLGLALVVTAALVFQWSSSPRGRVVLAVAGFTGLADILILFASFTLLEAQEAREIDIDERSVSVIAPGHQVF